MHHDHDHDDYNDIQPDGEVGQERESLKRADLAKDETAEHEDGFTENDYKHVSVETIYSV